jgi:NAD(P)-dependent dehydrogenase (short-subunit alcohol dehydrogenase family)
MADRLKDKIALLFGAGSCGPGWGNGKAASVLYAREGAKVVAVDKNLAAAEETRDIIKSEGGECIAVQADVTQAREVEAAVNKCIDAYERIDILHNNVGVGELGGPVETSEESWDRVMDVNIKGMFLTCKYVLPIMEAQRSGTIVNISSMASIRWSGVPYIGYYSSKAAVNQFTRAVALQYADRGIRANAILPGLMNTPMIVEPMKAVFENVEEMIRQRDAACPTGKMGDAWDVAYASVFLASDEAKYITGVLLPVDGGLGCRCT